jgi:predicted aconitase
MKLSAEERAIHDGEHGETYSKIMKSVVRYGEAFGAKRLVPINRPVHLVTSFGVSMLKPIYEIMDELIENNIKTKLPFTLDPRPFDHTNIKYSIPERFVFNIMYGKQGHYEKQLHKVGLKDNSAFSCACYLKEVGNIPKRGDILAWAESSAVVYANSVIGARTNRNSGMIDLFCGILGKTPEFGLLTDEGRKARWLIDLKTSDLPSAQVLGSLIGIKVVEDVPYVKGLDKYLGDMSIDERNDYLKDFGAASASNGAVGLYHIENITPEAIDHGEELLLEDYKTVVVEDTDIKKTKDSYPVMWQDINAKPKLCFIGCPHLSLQQLYKWTSKITESLETNGANKVKIKTIITTAPGVIEKFKEDEAEYKKLMKTGARLSSTCPLMNLNNPLIVKKTVITNSNKLRTYSTARYYDDNEILDLITRKQN